MTDNELGTLYDPHGVQKDAKKLLARANSIVFGHVTTGILIGYFLAYQLLPIDSVLLKLVVVGVVIATAYQIGDAMALTLRLTAQLSLCFVRIEENTRPHSTS